MGIAVAVVAHIILFAMLFGLFMVLASAVRMLLRIENRRALVALKVGAFVFAALPFMLFAANIVWANIAPPSVLFERVFGQEAGAEVSDLSGSSDAVNDMQHIFLAFRAPPERVRLLIQGLREVPPDRAGERVPITMSPPSTPAWWKAARCRDRSVFTAKSFRQWDDVVFTECRSDGRIYVEALWID